jgi:transposase
MLIGMEACATTHYWARELTKLGHEVRLMPPKDVKAYLKRNKNDAADAAAICEAVRRPRCGSCGSSRRSSRGD